MFYLIISLFLLLDVNLCAISSIITEQDRKILKNIADEDVLSEQVLRSEPVAAPLLVGLGYNCYAAYQIQRHGYRKAAYPFDWGFFPLVGLNRCLASNLDDFCKASDLEKVSDIGYIMHKLYKFAFIHDFHDITGSWQSHLPNVQTKYARRIQRFKDLANYSGRIYFVRTIHNEENALQRADIENIIQLKRELQKLFPMRDFELILIFYGLKNMHNWSIIGVRDFYISEIEHGPLSPFIEAQFCKIFESLGFAKIATPWTGHDFQDLSF